MKRKWLAICLAAVMMSSSIAQTAAAAGMEPDVFISGADEVFDDSFAAEDEEIVFEDEDPALESEEFLDGEMSEEPAFDSEEAVAFAEEGDSQEYITAAYVSEEQFNEWKEDGTAPDMEQLTCVTGSTENIFELLEKDGGESTGYCLMGGVDLDSQPYGELNVPDGIQVGIMDVDGLRLKKITASENLVIKTEINTPGTLELEGEVVLDGASVIGTVNGVGSADVIHLTECARLGGLQDVEKLSFEENGKSIEFDKGNGPIEFYEINNSSASYEPDEWPGLHITIEGYSEDRVPVFHNTFDIGTEYYEDGNSGPARIDICYIKDFYVPEGQDWENIELADGSRAVAFSDLSLTEIIDVTDRLGVNPYENGIFWVDTEGNAYRDTYDEDIFWPSNYSIERFAADGDFTAQQNFENYEKDETSENPTQQIYWARTLDAVYNIMNTDAEENPGSYYLVRLPKGGEIGTLTVPEGIEGIKYEASNEWNEETQEGSSVPVRLSEIQVPEGKQFTLLHADIDSEKLKVTGNAEFWDCHMDEGMLELNGELTTRDDLNCVIDGVGSEDVLHLTDGCPRFKGLKGVEKVSFEDSCRGIEISNGSDPIEFYEINNSSASYEPDEWPGLNITIEGYSEDRVPVFHNTFDIGIEYYEDGNSGPARIDICYIKDFYVPEGQDWENIELADGSRAVAFSDLSLTEIIDVTDRLGVNPYENGIFWVDTEGNAYRDTYDEDIFWPSNYSIERFAADGDFTAQQNFENYEKDETSENPTQQIHWAKTLDAVYNIMNTDSEENPGSYYLVRLPKGGEIGTLTVPEGIEGIKYEASNEWNEETQEGSSVPIRLSEIQVPEGKQLTLLHADIDSEKLKVTGNAEFWDCHMDEGMLELNGELTTRDDLNCMIDGTGSEDVLHLTGDWAQFKGLKGVEKVSFEENCTDIHFLDGNDLIEFYEIDNSLVDYESQGWRGLHISIDGYRKERVPIFHKTFDLGTEYYEDGNSGPAGIGIGYYEKVDTPEGEDWENIDLPDGSRAAAFADLSDAEIFGMMDRVYLDGTEDFHYNMDLDGNVYKEIHGEEGAEAFQSSVYDIARFIGDEQYSAQQNFENLGRDEVSENCREGVFWAKTPEMVSRIINIDAADNPGSYYSVFLPRGGEIGTLTVPSGAAGVKYEANNEWNEETETETRIPVKLSAIQVPEGKILALLSVDTESGSLSITGNGTTDLLNCRLNQDITAENLTLYNSRASVKSLKCQNLIMRDADLAVSESLKFDNMSGNDGAHIFLKSSAYMNMGNVTREQEDGIFAPLVICEHNGNKMPSVYLNGKLDLGSVYVDELEAMYDIEVLFVQHSYEAAEAEGSPLAENIFTDQFSIWDDEFSPFDFRVELPDTETAYLTLGKEATANRAELSPIYIYFESGVMTLDSGKEEGDRVYLVEEESEEATKAYIALNGQAIQGSIERAEIAAVKDQAYAGKEIEPELVVTYNGKQLTEGTDYTVTYSDNIEVGTASATVTGIGAYIGSKTIDFQILANSLSKATIAAVKDQAYTGKEIKPEVTVTYEGKKMTQGTDYTVTYSNNIKVGTATITVTGTGIYSESRTVNFKILARNLSKAKIAAVKDQVYTGRDIKPALTVTYGSTTLKEGTDYVVTYSNNKKIGTANVTVKGKGNYTGSISSKFAIVPKKGASYTVSGLKYQITKTASKDGTVTLTAPSKKTNTKIAVPDTVKIEGYTFKVTAIASNAFKSNTKLKTVVIGKNVTTIGKQAFYGCKVLNSLTIKGTGLKSVGSSALKGIYSKAVIKVPSSKLSAYKKLLKGKGQSSSVKIQKA